MGSYNMTGVLIKREKFRDRCTQGKCHVTMKTEIKVMHYKKRNTKDWELGESREQPLPLGPQEEPTLPTL